MAATDAIPVPKKGVAYRHYFAIRDNTGALVTTWAGQDSEVSKDGGNYADATSEATEIQTSGTGYIDLTATEMTADCVALKVTVTNTDALPYLVFLFPEEAGDIRTDVTQISGDGTAADNLELDYDGTGYAKTNSTVGTATTVTNAVSANVTQIGGDAQSMTDLKDFADAGYDPATNKVQGVVLVDTTTTNTDMRGTDSALTLASTSDGVSLENIYSYVLSYVAGNIDKSGDAYAYRDQADANTLYTHTVTATERTVA